MCEFCNNIAHNQSTGGHDPTRTMTLRNNFAREWRKRLSRAADKITANPLFHSYIAGSFSPDEFRKFIKRTVNEEIQTGFQEKYVNAAVAGAYIQGSNRLPGFDTLDTEGARDYPQFQVAFGTAIEDSINGYVKLSGDNGSTNANINHNAERTTALFFQAAEKSRLDIEQDEADAKESVKKQSKKGKSQSEATSAADTIIVGSHSTGILKFYEMAGVVTLVPEVEFVTAGDEFVCAICSSLSGNRFTIIEAIGVIPIYARCRCSWWPVRIGA